MVWRNRRAAYYFAAVLLVTVGFTLTYNAGMRVWEGRPQPLYRSVEVVFQTFTTTGYGEDAPWATPQMNVLVVVMQLTGIGLILTAVDVFAVPWIQEALAVEPPTAVPDLADHVVVCGYTSLGETFLEELRNRNHDYVIVEPDREAAVELHREEVPVVHGDPERRETLENAGLVDARTVLVDAPDDISASVVLTAQDVAPHVDVVTLIEDADLAQYHYIAGADEVLSPRQLLGRSLAAQVPTAVSTNVEEGVVIGENFELVELAVREGSDLAGQSFREARIRDRFGVTVIGAWVDTDFRMPVDPGTIIRAGTRLLVAGSEAELDRLRDATAASVRPLAPQHVVIAGLGQTGVAACEALSDTNTRLTVLDRESDEGVDVVGDAREPERLDAAGIGEARAFILALGDDTSTVFATLVARDRNPDLDIVARADEEADEPKLYRAGADYVQSLATVSGRMLLSTVFEDEEVLGYHQRIEVVQVPAGDLAGQTLADAAVRETTGCTVLAVERDDVTVTDIDPHEFVFEATDEVVVAGTDASVEQFEAQFRD
ncbi:potassium channel family protein [Haloglomus salinum]|uniref:potassium channel family protein n=1 Tax=Haloglomus salinum TaxID=2962673 RepID=UPI0020C99868|nr:NAD-binding protein [Haloglomus salinum]